MKEKEQSRKYKSYKGNSMSKEEDCKFKMRL